MRIRKVQKNSSPCLSILLGPLLRVLLCVLYNQALEGDLQDEKRIITKAFKISSIKIVKFIGGLSLMFDNVQMKLVLELVS